MRRAAIVGCGTAGPAAALNIVRRLGPQWRVELFDKAERPSAVGSGIGNQPVGMTAAHKLGILPDLLRHGAHVDSIKTWSRKSESQSRAVLDVAYTRYDPRLFGLGLHRGVLFSTLMEACAREDAIATRFGIDIEGVEQGAESVTIRDARGTPHGPYDLCVLAAGTRSQQLREQLGMGASSWAGSFRRYSYGALFALLPDPEATFGTTLQQVHAGPGCHTTLGFLPTGHAWGDPASGGGAGGRGQVGPHPPLAGVASSRAPSPYGRWGRTRHSRRRSTTTFGTTSSRSGRHSIA
jgi:2-polyprenyl-6-methoxyphenol hydroxylase-like FAD-dependent oxidoreductase